MLHEKVFHVDKNKMMLHQKNIFCAEKLLFFSRMAPHTTCKIRNFYFAQILTGIVVKQHVLTPFHFFSSNFHIV